MTGERAEYGDAVVHGDAFDALAKPVKLYRQLLRSPVLEEGERLLEPFCGGGPGAAIVAERVLDYWGVDANPDAVDQARQRLEQQRLGQVTL